MLFLQRIFKKCLKSVDTIFLFEVDEISRKCEK